jgi:hypothetical protein
MGDIRKVAGSGKSSFSTKGAKKDQDDLSQSAQRTQRNSYFFIAGEGPAMKNNSAASRVRLNGRRPELFFGCRPSQRQPKR